MNYLFKENKYTKWYFSIVNSRKYRNKKSEKYLEKHHIIPKSLGGSNNIDNLVFLTFKEHFIVHLLLTKMCKNKKDYYKMHRAIVAFQRYNDAQERKMTSKHFSYIKTSSKIANSGENHVFYGTTRSKETKEKISIANSGEKNGMFGKRSKMSEEHKAKIKESLQKSEKLKNRGENWRKNISKSQSRDIVFVSITTNKIVFSFSNCGEAANFLGCNKSNITNALRTERIVGKKLKTMPEKCKVMYKDEYENI